MIRILFLGANPADTPRLALERELRSIDDKLQRGRFRDQYALDVALAVRRTELIERIQRHEPTILHFSGHGSESGELLFETEGGKAAPANSEGISEVFRVLAPLVGLRCVVLNACFSDLQARAIAEHVELRRRNDFGSLRQVRDRVRLSVPFEPRLRSIGPRRVRPRACPPRSAGECRASLYFMVFASPPNAASGGGRAGGPNARAKVGWSSRKRPLRHNGGDEAPPGSVPIARPPETPILSPTLCVGTTSRKKGGY
jgi:hypothetical protein